MPPPWATKNDEELEALLAERTASCYPYQSRTSASRNRRWRRVASSPCANRGRASSCLYITCQSPHFVARYVSLALGLPHTNIRVIAKDVGGAFGLKNHPWKEEIAVIVAALKFWGGR